MPERVLISIVLIAGGLALYRLFVALQLRRASAVLPGLEGRQAGRYLILYFTSPTCGPCRTTQRPALQAVQAAFGEQQLQIVTVDVTEQPALAEQWGVMTLPTTFLFDARGNPGEYNPGVVTASQLIRQLRDMGARETTLPGVSPAESVP